MTSDAQHIKAWACGVVCTYLSTMWAFFGDNHEEITSLCSIFVSIATVIVMWKTFRLKERQAKTTTPYVDVNRRKKERRKDEGPNDRSVGS